MVPLMITKKDANEMYEFRIPRPRRTFIFIKDGLWVGVDNRKNDMETKKFSTIKGCMKWLKGNASK